MENWKANWLRKPLKEQFEMAVIIARNLPREKLGLIGHQDVLQFYAFYKQATKGPCQLDKPVVFDITKRAKWKAWSELGNMSSDEAMILYLERFKEVFRQFYTIVNSFQLFLNSILMTLYYVALR